MSYNVFLRKSNFWHDFFYILQCKHGGWDISRLLKIVHKLTRRKLLEKTEITKIAIRNIVR